MAGFKDIIGHEQIIEHLQNAHLQWLCSVKSMEKRHVWSAIPADRHWDIISRILFM